MNILWITAINETEFDILCAMRSLKYRFRILSPRQSNDYFFPFKFPPWADIIYSKDIQDFKTRVTYYLKNRTFDFVIKRAGWALGSQDAALVPNLCRMHSVPCALWAAEQGEQREWQFQIARHYDWVWANNEQDVAYYKAKGIKKVSYFPFGCIPDIHHPVPPNPKYETDIACYGNPLYGFYKAKTQCTDDMIVPLLDMPYRLALWGRWDRGTGGWARIADKYPAITNHYSGTFEYGDIGAVNSSCKIMLGLSASIAHGGYGSKLARALGCRTFVLWHSTLGMEHDFENYKHLAITDSPEMTQIIVDYYLTHAKERKKVALAGQRYAYKHLNYCTNFEQILKEI